jgi:MYXO-CTERM domain-containing protein
MYTLLSLVLATPAADAKWLIIQEACCADSHDVLDGALAGLGETFDVQSGAAVGARTPDDLFANYDVIFIGNGSGGQQISDADVQPLIRPGGVVDDYVLLGGVLMIHGAHNDAQDVVGPGGSKLRVHTVSAVLDDFPTITDRDNEFIAGTYRGGIALTNADFASWNSTCHGAVDPPPMLPPSGGVNLGTSPVADEWNEILFSPANNDPAMLEFTYGCGYVFMDMMTFDWAGFAPRDALVPEAAAYIHGIEGNFPFCNQQPVDSDGDTIEDADDNCPVIANLDQADVDGDGLGDACDACDDSIDSDGDGIGDACDLCNGVDSDGDGVCDSDDICPNANDFLDNDADGVPDGCDICPLDNPNDSDGDGTCDHGDLCPGSDDNIDGDGDGQPDACDPCPISAPDDTDGDGACDDVDLCPGFDDTDDKDLDALPDHCDNCPFDAVRADDDDGDGVCNSVDICLLGDDALDADHDLDPDACDNCPDISNPTQVDGDVDAFGAACDCNDANAAAYPGGTEVCDGLDNDCNGTVDGDDAIDAVTWFTDGDGDGDGDAGAPVEGCGQPPANTSTNSDDCDDADPRINPSAVEICDGIDNDCDGTLDDASCSPADTDEPGGGAGDGKGCGCDAGSGSPASALGLLLAGSLALRRRR